MLLWPSRQRDIEPASVARYCYDASLLFQHMARLDLDREELAKDDPLLFRELQGLCSLCRNKEECVRDLAQPDEVEADDRWRAYCPNAATLNLLGALQCSWAAQHLRRPRSTAYLDCL